MVLGAARPTQNHDKFRTIPESYLSLMANLRITPINQTNQFNERVLLTRIYLLSTYLDAQRMTGFTAAIPVYSIHVAMRFLRRIFSD
jgi:hypothetical protein